MTKTPTTWRYEPSEYGLDGESPDGFVNVPTVFEGTPWTGIGDYAKEVAGPLAVLLPTSDDGPDPDDLEERIASAFHAAHQHLMGIFNSHYTVLAWYDRRKPPIPVFISLWEQDHDAVSAMRHYSGADQEDDVLDKPIVESFHNGQSGEGMRALSYVETGEPDRRGSAALSAVLAYAWRCEQYRTDVVVFTVTDDFGGLQAVRDDFDTFARDLAVV